MGAVGVSVVASIIAAFAVAFAFWWTPIIEHVCTAPCAPSAPRPKYYIPTKQVEHLNHVIGAFDRAGYDLVRNDNYTNDWHVMWTFHNPFYPREGEVDLPAMMRDLKPEQKVNQIPGASFFTSKWELAKRSEQFDFVPRTFVMPDQYDDFTRYHKKQPAETVWVKKGAKHRGVQVVDPEDPSLNSAGSEETFVQQFVKPYLIEGRMWDVGMYVAITSYNPLRAYYFDNLLLRFCSVQFEEDLSKAHRDAYVVADDYLPPWAIRSLREYYRMGMSTANVFRGYFVSLGVDASALVEQIKACVAKLLIDYESTLWNAAMSYPNGRKNFFALYRFDFLVDRNFKPWLMEVNQSPNLSSAHTKDLSNMFQRIAYGLLSLAGLYPNGLNHPLTSDNDFEVIAHTNDVDIAYDVCRDCADDCSGDLCYVCRKCRTPSQSRMIKEMVSEHLNREGFLRLYPPYKKLHDLLQNATAPGKNNKLLQTWLELKCRDDYTWC